MIATLILVVGIKESPTLIRHCLHQSLRFDRRLAVGLLYLLKHPDLMAIHTASA